MTTRTISPEDLERLQQSVSRLADAEAAVGRARASHAATMQIIVGRYRVPGTMIEGIHPDTGEIIESAPEGTQA